MADLCSNCGRSVRLIDRLCDYCDADLLPPNVRFASRQGEAERLAEIEQAALDASASNGTQSEINRLRALAASSRLVINRRLRSLQLWIDSSDQLYLNFYKLKQRRVPMEDDRYNRQRVSAENTISPEFFETLTIGALTIDNVGMSYYGDWSVLVADDAVRLRASVFWENPFLFNARMKIISGDDPPEGYRAPWDQRGRLAVAKLAAKLKPGDDDAALGVHFMGPDRANENCDFIEVHIYGSIHADAIQTVVGPTRMSKTDRTEWSKLKRKLVARGVAC